MCDERNITLSNWLTLQDYLLSQLDVFFIGAVKLLPLEHF